MKKQLFLLRLIVVFATLKCLLVESRSLREIKDDPVIMEMNDDVSASNRKLFGICEDGSQPVIHYFEVIVQIQPDMSVSGVCTLADQMKLGSDINSILSSHAIGDSGIDQTLKFKAAVCTIPFGSTRRALQLATFLWKGGGGCRGCPCDCQDGRRDLQFAVWGTTEWFNDVYAPQLETSIFNAILTNVVPAHPKCLGQVPVVVVEVTKITLIQLLSRFQCQGGKVISLLDTISLTSIAVIDRMCENCVTIDFSKTSRGIPLRGGMDISQQWQMDGLTIEGSAFQKKNPTNARILDTSNSECLEEVNSQEFGSPNRSCPNRGPGWGRGGSIGTEGENCRPLGNVLVLQDVFFDWDDCPRPSVFGGRLSFIFETPVFLHDLGVLDMNEFDSSLQLTYSDNVVEFFNFTRFGVNAVQRVIVSKPNVKKLELVFGFGSSAVTEISYCRVCEAKAGHDDNHDCIVAGNVINKVSEVIEVNDFEDPNQAVALNGWHNGQIDNSHFEAFNKLLGKYTPGMNAPYKVFSVPRNAETIIVELDFYEIDGWDLQDSIAIFVDGEQISMQFNHAVDEGRREGITQLGVKWTSVSTTLPQNLGLLSFNDQKHHITIEVPSSSKLYSDGELRILLSCVARQSGTLSAGWDNVMISVRHGCPLLNSANVAAGALAVSPTLQPTHPPTNPLTKQPSTNLPIWLPTNPPNSQPTKQPTNLPTRQPTNQPIKQPTNLPTRQPTNQPINQPTNLPTRQPTNLPTRQPTNLPTRWPTNLPTRQPTNQPSRQPTKQPTNRPTNRPTNLPTTLPTLR